MVQAASNTIRNHSENAALRASTTTARPTVVATLGVANPASQQLDQACRSLAHLLPKVAHRFARRLPGHVEIDELAAAGAVGLVQAVQQHIDKPMVELERLAVRRIWGAMLDHLRASDHLTRRQRHAVAVVAKARAQLEQDGQDTSTSGVAKELGLSEDRVRYIQDDLAAVSIAPLPVGDILAGRADALEEVSERELRERVAHALSALPERLRTVLTLYYYEDLTYQEISDLLGISRSRICQLHAQAVEGLRRGLAAYA